MRKLLVTTSAGVIAALVLNNSAAAETVISTAVTAPVLTGTQGDDIRITSAGSVKVTSGTAVTINSNDSVKNEGTIGITGANNATGILANIDLTGNITNSGTIAIDENFTATDSDNDGDLDGAFAQGTNRFGIRVAGGGTFTGNVTNSGTITVEGNQSAGIAIDSLLTGTIANSGNITVTGNDSVGLRADDVTGNATHSAGSINVRGQNAVGVLLGGNIGGALNLQGTVTSSGYRYTTPPADTSKLDADDLLQGGPAVLVGGNVAGGILLDARPADNDSNDTDEDDDGVLDSNEATASINSYGSAAALKIGSSTQAVALGAVASSADGYGLVNKGTIASNGVYTGVSATGLLIGGTGNAVTVAGGMGTSGSITARALNADATAMRIGAGASVPVIDVSGSISAVGGGAATTGATAIAIDSGANVMTLRNSGSIQAGRVGTAGTATAILDSSGSLDLIENKGAIVIANAASLGDKAIAIDLRANGGGATVRQVAAAAGKPAPQITGDILFGAGADVLEIFAGNVTGMADFGGGADSLTLGGGAVFRGSLANSGGLAVNVGADSTLDLTNTGIVAMASLTTGADATLGVTLNTLTGAVTLYDVAGAASFGTGTTIAVSLQNAGGVAGTYKIIEAGSLAGLTNLSSVVAELPFLYGSSLVTTTPGEVSLEVRVRTADELGLNDSEGAILGAALDASDADPAIARMFLTADDQDELRDTLQQLLPDHAGGAFEVATRGSRLTGGLLANPRMSVSEGNFGFWLQQVGWTASKDIGGTSDYDANGWGAAGGVEKRLSDVASLGISLGYFSGKDARRDNELISSEFEGGVYMRGGYGPFRAYARATAGTVHFDGTRVFAGEVDGTTVRRSTDGEWKGRLMSASAGASYELRIGRISLRPTATVEHFKLTEKAYEESGGGDAINLNVGKRTSDETAAVGTVALGYDLMGGAPGDGWLRIELEGGRRQILSGELGSTTASFDDGESFTLEPEQRTSGFRGALRLDGGGPGLGISAEVNAEEQQDKISIGGRLGIRFAL